jgi:hypothetical protein
MLVADTDYSGAGLSLRAGENWFAGIGMARHVSGAGMTGREGWESVNVSGGFRWPNGQSLSLEVSRGRGPGERLGLAVNYGWPRYYMRFSYDTGVGAPAPQDHLKFSAGVRF